MSDPASAASPARRALLLTDLVDSTLLTAQLGDAGMAALWAAHDRMARDLLARWGGREIDKTDGMLMLFEEVRNAARYAAEYHDALARLPSSPRARAGLHFADVMLRENDAADVARGAKPLEVEGIAKSVTARVMALADGGRTLMTHAAAQEFRSPDWVVASHGFWSLKGVPEPLELFEAGAQANTGAPPRDSEKAHRVIAQSGRWVPLSDLPHNLPAPVSELFGRERELDELRAHLRDARLVTLTGMGGMGKTQLACQVAREIRAGFPDGTWFVDLQAIRNPDHVVAQIAQVLDLREEAGKSALQTVCAHLRSRCALLVLDNCEQVIDECAACVQTVLQSAPGVRIIATSREPLAVQGEHLFRVSPLPAPSSRADTQAIRASPAVQLFVARANTPPDVLADPQRATEIAILAARLEGIPLAIELAAARSRAMSVAEITRRLDEQRYAVLTQGGRTRAARQQTLTALLDWSHGLLDEAERRAFEGLGVFAGGFDLDAAQAVLADEHTAVDDVPDLLVSLVDKSLLVFDAGANGRYRMLETVREYAAQKLQAGGNADAVQQRHCAHFFELVKRANRAMEGAGMRDAIQLLEVEIENLRAAMALALRAPSQPVLAVKIAVAAQGFWVARGYAREGLGYAKAALQLPAVRESGMARAFALYVAAVLAGSLGSLQDALAFLEESLGLRRAIGAPTEIGASLSTLSFFRMHVGDAQGALPLEHEALQLFTATGDRMGQCISWMHIGQAHHFLGRGDDTMSATKQALALAQEIGNAEVEAEAELMFGELSLASDRAAAAAHFARALSVCEASGITRLLASCWRWQGKLASAQGEHALALEHLTRAADVFRRFGFQDELLSCIEDAVPLVDPATGAALAASLTSARERHGFARRAEEQEAWGQTVAGLKDTLGTRFDPAWTEGMQWSLDEDARRLKATAGAK